MNKFLRRPAVEQMTGLPTSSLYFEIDEGRFPKPVKIGVRSVAWLESDIVEWQQARLAESGREVS